MNDAAQEKALIQMEGGRIQLHSLEDAYRFSKYVLASGLAPKSFATAESILIACQFGNELGLPPMQALQSIAIINGRPSIFGKALPAIVQARGHCAGWRESFEGEGEALTAVCWAKRTNGIERESRFSVADAKRAGLWGKAGPWTQYPKDMMGHKARARCLSVLFSDDLCGLGVYEDLQDVPPVIKPVEASTIDPLAGELGFTPTSPAPREDETTHRRVHDTDSTPG